MDMPARKMFGAKLRELRHDAEMTLSGVSKACGITLTYLSDIERGEKDAPRQVVIKRLLKFFKKDELLVEMLNLAILSKDQVRISTSKSTFEECRLFLKIKHMAENGLLNKAMCRKAMEALR